MRWNANKPPVPKSGQTRVRTVFAWKPRAVEDMVVWLESYEVHESYFQPASGAPGWWAQDREALYSPCYY